MNNNFLNNYAPIIENALDKYIAEKSCLQEDVIKAMRYSVLGGGKRIRGGLILEFARILDQDIDKFIPFACAIEMIHAYSLIHDDLPCMDNDSMRRGKPSCHIEFGEDIALLAGDALLTHSTLVALNSKFPADNLIKAITSLNNSAGVFGMIGGQVIDLQSEGKEIELDTLNALHAGKTVALLTAPAHIVCDLVSADEETRSALVEYSEKIGLCFQIIDDILDVEGNTEVLGKKVGSDSGNKKSTFVSIYGLNESKEIANELTQNAINSIDTIGLDTKSLKKFALHLLKRKF